LEHARQDLRLVCLFALRDDVALAGASTSEVDAQVVFGKRNAGRATVDDDDVARPVRFAGGGDTEGLTEAIARHALAPGAYSLKRISHSYHEPDRIERGATFQGFGAQAEERLKDAVSILVGLEADGGRNARPARTQPL